MVTKNDVIKAAKESGIENGDSVIIHSSFKSFGEVENGADTVVSGFFEAIGKEGTLMFPTLCQNDWKNVYKNWHMDAPSDVGYLTNYFRKLPGAKRSNQASHSVAAIGKDAEYFTKTHGESGLLALSANGISAYPRSRSLHQFRRYLLHSSYLRKRYQARVDGREARVLRGTEAAYRQVPEALPFRLELCFQSSAGIRLFRNQLRLS